jgi:hypothetical protein
VEWGQDPSLFIDEGKPYLVWGGRGAILIGELNQDLRSIKPETIRNLSEQIGGYEGPFLHRRGDRYYLTYPALDNEQWPQRMCHAVSDNPLGPYKDLGVFIDEYPGNSGTIHGSVFEFRGQWYSFYHSGFVSGTATSRSLMLDKVEYAADGRILPIAPRPAAAGMDQVEGYSTQVILDAAVADLAGGKLHATRVEHGSGSSGAGYVTGLSQQEYGVSVLFHVGPPREYEVWVRFRAAEPTNARVIAGRHLFYDGNQNQDYEQYINRGTLFPATGGEWQEILIGTHSFEFGDHQVRLSNSHNLPAGVVGLEIDSFRFVPLG